MDLGAGFKALLPVSGKEDIGRPVVSLRSQGKRSFTSLIFPSVFLSS